SRRITAALWGLTSSRSDFQEGCRRLRLTLHDQKEPIGRAFALVQPAGDRSAPGTEPAKSTEEQVEIIKVYLEARRQEQQNHQQSLKMLSDEVSQIQEVRYCLKSLREQMAAKTTKVTKKTSLSPKPPNSLPFFCKDADDEAERDKLREVSKRLYAQLQEAERKHQEERDRLLRERLSDKEERLRVTEEASERKDVRIEELKRLLGGMEQESATLRATIESREDELRELRRFREEGHKGEERAEQLEKEVAILKEKIHHLDDMLKSQQRKVRHMIEQLQNSRMVIQERDRVIKELEEKVAFLEAENREMRDQMDYYLGGQRSNSYLSSERNPQVVYSKPLKPSTSSTKPLPFIKVIEIKS
uniref:Tuftelin 1a n=1 Tax=Kryptolebias marmoratus TaxID=37003 RepID=A0A3Q2ZJ74_KRYMA